MDYPREFSAHARAKVEAAKIRARRRYVERRENDRDLRYGSDHESNLREYILRVFLAFAKEACQLGSEGVLGADRIRKECAEFLRRFTIEAYYEDGYDRGGSRLSEMTSHWSGGLLTRVEQEYRKASEWQKYEGLLLATADKIAKSQRRQSKTNHSETRRALVEAFICKMSEHGQRVKRKDIWTVAGYREATEFERYQRGSSRTGVSAADNFERVLNMQPEDFLKTLEKLRSK